MTKRINYDDHIGQTLGKRTIIGYDTTGLRRLAFCRCECGRVDKVIAPDLFRGKSQSCLDCCDKNKNTSTRFGAVKTNP